MDNTNDPVGVLREIINGQHVIPSSRGGMIHLGDLIRAVESAAIQHSEQREIVPAGAVLPKGVSIQAFIEADSKQWYIGIKHPFGTSRVSMTNMRDTQLAQLLAAPVEAPVPEARSDMVARVDAAMVAMSGITPPLRRSECEKLICAALSAAPVPEAKAEQDRDMAIANAVMHACCAVARQRGLPKTCEEMQDIDLQHYIQMATSKGGA